MAPQVRPGPTQPTSSKGPQESEKVIRRRPAYSIRARDLESHAQAGCMAANYSCDPGPKKALGIKGASMYNGMDAPAFNGINCAKVDVSSSHSNQQERPR